MSDKKYVIAVDQSTTGTKAILINHSGVIVQKCYLEHKQIYPHQGWVEHNPLELLDNVKNLIIKVLEEAKVKSNEIQCLAITNQRETALAWDRITGIPVYNAVVWQCNRASEQCEELRKLGLEKTIKEKTGLPLSEFFSAAKLKWIIDNVEEARKCAGKGNLMVGTIDSWLVWNLSTEKSHVTDYSNASRTQLFNLNTLCWDQELLNTFGLSENMMPKVVFSDEVVGHFNIDGNNIPIAGIIGDSHGALFAQCGLKMGTKVTYGTGSSIITGTGEKKVICSELATTVSYACRNLVNFAVEGNINSTGATIKWLSDKLKVINSSGDAEKVATEIEDNGGVYFVPAFTGLGAPHWSPKAKALIVGITFDTDKRHVVRAALESIAFQITDVIKAIEKGCGIELQEIMADGKPTENKFLMEFQSSISGKKIVLNAVEEASAFGSALLAGLATDFWKEEDLKDLIHYGAVFTPKMDDYQVEKLYKGWNKAVSLAKQA